MESTGVDVVAWPKKEDEALKKFLGLGYVLENTFAVTPDVNIARVRRLGIPNGTIFESTAADRKELLPGWGIGWNVSGTVFVETGASDNHFGIPIHSRAGYKYEVTVVSEKLAGETLRVAFGGKDCGTTSQVGAFSCIVESDGQGDLWINTIGVPNSEISAIKIKRVDQTLDEPMIYRDGLVEVHGKMASGTVSSQTNWGSYVGIDADLPDGGSATVNIWAEPHLEYYLNGKRVPPKVDALQRPLFDLPPGKSSVRLEFVSPISGALFWCLVGAIVAWVAGAAWWILHRRRFQTGNLTRL